MTAPRQVIPGRTYLLSRRCTQRQHLLRPDAKVRQLYLYCLGEAAERYGITLHGWLVMSNHEHVLFRDNEGKYPEFIAHLHKMIAKAMNVHLGRWENFWATEQPSVVYLVEAQDRLDKLIYLLANPVAAHLVDRVSDWPGASSLMQNLSGASVTIQRPLGYFREDGPMPDQVTLRAERLDGFENLTQEEWGARVASKVRLAEAAAREERTRKKLPLLGRKRVLATKPTDAPSTVAPRRNLRPCVACKDVQRMALELAAVRGFRTAHRSARLRWCAGRRRVLFPYGTYRMRRLGARCEPAVASAVPA